VETAVNTNTRSPHTTGVEEAAPGIATFHLTFLLSLHSSGGSASGATPVASGPRHCGQLRRASSLGAAAARSVKTNANNAIGKDSFFIVPNKRWFELPKNYAGRRHCASRVFHAYP
jgi:hypothetical protein